MSVRCKASPHCPNTALPTVPLCNRHALAAGPEATDELASAAIGLKRDDTRGVFDRQERYRIAWERVRENIAA